MTKTAYLFKFIGKSIFFFLFFPITFPILVYRLLQKRRANSFKIRPTEYSVDSREFNSEDKNKSLFIDLLPDILNNGYRGHDLRNKWIIVHNGAICGLPGFDSEDDALQFAIDLFGIEQSWIVTKVVEDGYVGNQ